MCKNNVDEVLNKNKETDVLRESVKKTDLKKI